VQYSQKILNECDEMVLEHVLTWGCMTDDDNGQHTIIRAHPGELKNVLMNPILIVSVWDVQPNLPSNSDCSVQA
jgi:hypothetical protein